MIRSWIVFNDIHSDAMHIRITKLPPLIRAPERVKQLIQIPGRHGSLTLLESGRPIYNNFNIDIGGIMLPGADVDSLMAWLSGAGKLTLSTDPNKMQFVRASDAVTFERVTRIIEHRAFTVTMNCQPFRYEIYPTTVIYTTSMPGGSENIIFNPGTIESEPIITVYGSGDILLSINKNVLVLNNVSEYITIDTGLGAYKGNISLDNAISGELPVLVPGNNTISWVGATRVEVTPRWRWL